MIKKALKIILILTVLLVSLFLLSILYIYIQLPPWPESVPGVNFNVPQYAQISPKQVTKENAAYYFYQLNKVENFDPGPFLKVIEEPLTAESRLTTDKLILGFPQVVKILENAVECNYCLFALNYNDGTFNHEAIGSSLVGISASAYFLYLAEMAFVDGKIKEGYNEINKFNKMISFILQTKPDRFINILLYCHGLNLISEVLNRRLGQKNSPQELALLRQLLVSIHYRKVNFSLANFKKSMILETELMMNETAQSSEALNECHSVMRQLSTHTIKSYELYDQTGILGELSEKYKKVLLVREPYRLLLYGEYKAIGIMMSWGSSRVAEKIEGIEFTRAKLNAIQMAVTVKVIFQQTGKVPTEVTELLSQTELNRAAHYNHAITYETVNNRIKISVEGDKSFIIRSKLKLKKGGISETNDFNRK